MADRFVAEQADLVFRAETGQARADVTSLRRDFHTATSGMSSDTLKLTVAQEKLDKALIRHGPASTQAKQAEIAYRNEVARTTTAVKDEEVALSRSQRAKQSLRTQTSALTSSFTGLAAGAGLLTGALVGGAGLVYALKGFVDAARDSELVLGQTSVAVEDAGLSWDAYRQRVNAAATSISRSAALDDEDVSRSRSTSRRSRPTSPAVGTPTCPPRPTS